MSLGNYPENYLLFNQKLSKQLSLVLEIEGVGFFGIADTFTTVRYGDQGVLYGLPGLVYGGLRSINTVLPYMMLDGGLTIQQRIEPEVGRGNIGVLTINLIDYGGALSYALAPGNVVPEIMGVQCRLWLGYTDTSFPTDFVLVYQGQITQCVCPPGKVQLQISDSTLKSRQPIFDISSTTLLTEIPAPTGPFPATGLLVSVSNTAVLHEQILGPDGTYDQTVSTYAVIDSEIFEYPATGILSATGLLCSARGVLGTGQVDHAPGATVNGSAGFGYNDGGINCIDFALKLLLSGWDGPDFTNVGILSFVYDYQGNYVPNEFVLATEDALLDLGLTAGDYFYITGSASGNSVSGQITGITTGVQGTNVIIQTDQTFTIENPTSAVVAFRSQYDTFPTTCGVGCYTSEVDVATFQAIQNSYFTAAGTSNLRGYYDEASEGIDTIVGDIMLPLGCYSISRYGRISMAVTKPPLPGNGTKLVQLDYTNVCDPDKIQVTRATNQRSFYNEISYEYDYDVADQTYNSIQYFIDTNSLEEFGYTVALPIQAKTVVSSELGGALIAQTRGQAILTRFDRCLVWVELTVNWSVGSLLEVSDIVVLVDNGTLKIMNFETGERNIGTQLFEVIDRNYQIASGNVKLKLLGGLGFSLTSRFGLISPSSVLTAGCTTTNLRVMPSYGQTALGAEIAKWSQLVGQTIMVHDYAWGATGSAVIQGLNPADPAGILVAPALPFAATAGMILDIAPYNPAAGADAKLKALYAHISPSIPVLSGVSTTEFTIPAASGSLLTVGNWVMLRNSDYSIQSGQCTVSGVTGGTVTLSAQLVSDGVPFVPTTGFFCEGVGWSDKTGSYLYG